MANKLAPQRLSLWGAKCAFQQAEEEHQLELELPEGDVVDGSVEDLVTTALNINANLQASWKHKRVGRLKFTQRLHLPPIATQTAHQDGLAGSTRVRRA